MSLEEKYYQLSITNKELQDFLVPGYSGGIWFKDLQTKSVWISHHWFNNLGISADDNTLETVLSRVLKEDEEHFLSFIKHTNELREPVQYLNIRFRHKNGKTIWLELRKIIVSEQDQNQQWMVILANDVSRKTMLQHRLSYYNQLSGVGFWEKDFVLHKSRWSAASLKLIEHPSGTVTPFHLWHDLMVNQEDQKRWLQVIDAARYTGMEQSFSAPIKTGGGKIKWVKLQFAPVFENEFCRRIVGTVTDITKEKEIQLKLTETLDRLSLAADVSKLGVWEVNFITKEVHWDDTMYELYQIKKDKGSDIQDLWMQRVEPVYLQEIEQAIENARRLNGIIELAFPIKLPNGAVRYLKTKAKLYRNKDGRVEKMLGTTWDISADYLKQEQLLEELSRVEALIQESPLGMLMLNRDFEIITASKRYCEIFETKLEKIKKQALNMCFPSLFEEFKLALIGANEGKESDRLSHRCGVSNKFINWQVKPWFAKGEIAGSIIFIEDHTHEIELENSLTLSEQAFRNNFDNAAIGMAIVGPNGEWLNVNQKLCQIIGYSESELYGLTFQDITYPDDLDSDLGLMHKVLDGKILNYQMYKRYFHKDGHLVHVMLGVSAVRSSSGELMYFISQIIDISDQIQYQQRLTQELERNQSILDAGNQVIILSTDKDGRVTSFNKGATKILGFEEHEVINKMNLCDFVLEDEIKSKQALVELKEARILKPFDVFTYKDEGETGVHGLWTLLDRDRKKLPVQLSVTPILVNGEVQGYLALACDVSELTETKQEVINLLEISNSQNEKLRGFTHIVSHNLRSHSGNLEQLIQLLADDYPTLAQTEVFVFLQRASQNLKDTVQNLHETAVVNALHPADLSVIPLDQAVEDSLRTFEREFQQYKFDLSVRVDPGLKVVGVLDYIVNVLQSLISNAIRFRDDQRRPMLVINAANNRGKVLIEIADNGLGIDLDKQKHKLFGLYKVFHPSSAGKGVGLFMARNQMEAMGGKIEVESEVGKGSIFRLYLNHG